MSCKRVSAKARAEQDYYLRLDKPHAEVSEQDRLDFVRYDSHGGVILSTNPIFVAKTHYGMYVNYQRETHDPLLFPGGELVRETDPRFLREVFGAERVLRWESSISEEGRAH